MTVGVRALALVTAIVLAAGGCLMGQTKTDYESLAHVASEPRAANGVDSGSIDAATDAELAHAVRLATVLRLAHARNPDLAETRARLRAALERVRSASRLPDLELK